MDAQHPLAAPQRRLERFGDARAVRGGESHPVLDDLEAIALPPVDARVTLAGEQVLHFLRGEVLRHGDGEGDDDARRRLARAEAPGQVLDDALGRVPADLVPAAAAVQARGAGEEQLQVVVQLRHRAHRGSRSAHRIGLIDRDGGRDPLDGVAARLVHAVEELPSVGREGLHVAALPFRIHGVEGERGLARTAHSGDHRQLVERQPQIQILEVVLPGSPDVDEPGSLINPLHAIRPRFSPARERCRAHT